MKKTKCAPGEVWTHNLRIAHTLTDYKYGALTYCATGATTISIDYFYDKPSSRCSYEKDPSLSISTRLPHQFHSRMLSHYYSVWRLWAAVFRPWPDSPLLRQPGGQRLPPNHHIDAELSADILSTWRSMREDPWPQAIHQTQFSSSWVTEARHYLQLWAYLCKALHVFGCGQKRLMT